MTTGALLFPMVRLRRGICGLYVQQILYAVDRRLENAGRRVDEQKTYVCARLILSRGVERHT